MSGSATQGEHIKFTHPPLWTRVSTLPISNPRGSGALGVRLDQGDGFVGEALAEDFVSFRGVMEVVHDAAVGLFFIVEVIGIDPGAARVGFGEFLLGFADVFFAFKSFRSVESAVADAADDDVDIFEIDVGLDLPDQLLEIDIVGGVVEVGLALHPDEGDGLE